MLRRTPVIAGNWKMNLGRAAALELARNCAYLATEFAGAEIAIFPSNLQVGEIARLMIDVPLRVGAQNCHAAESGAFTGEISPRQLIESEVSRVLVGHSERRHTFGETEDLIAHKVALALGVGLHVTFCVGETLDEREADRAGEVVRRQLQALTDLPSEVREHLDLAYEPVWAIGTGQTATPDTAQEMHDLIRKELDIAGGFEKTRILYGGSVKPDNCAALAAQPDLDGFLVGGASLKIDQFRAIVEVACATGK